jgi:hypothetical protein
MLGRLWRQLAGPEQDQRGSCGAPAIRVSLALLCLVLYAGETLAWKRPAPATEAEVAQAWVGLAEGGLYGMRLVLHPDGTGDGAIVFTTDDAKVFRVTEWRLSKGQLTFRVAWPLEVEATFTELRGAVVGTQMTLVISDRERSWKRRVYLRPEAWLDSILTRLRRAPLPENGQTGS